MKIDDLLLLLGAGYSKEEISSMMKSEKKQEADSEKKQEPDSEKKQEPDSEKKQEFDYDKLADSIIAKMQANNRSANLDNKNSKDDWLSQLSLKF